ncbi:hypothetical protein KHA80_17610 [Anaerobacillus sp. HL2]|nr:hypothetical protein KHA80_17610 [Anaerobacillus sp. HL2]
MIFCRNVFIYFSKETQGNIRSFL